MGTCFQCGNKLEKGFSELCKECELDLIKQYDEDNKDLLEYDTQIKIDGIRK